MNIDILYSEIEQAQANWALIRDSLVNAKYDFSTPRQIIDGDTTENLHQKAILVFEILFSLKPSDYESAIATAIGARSNDLKSSLSMFQIATNTILAQIRQYSRENNIILDINSNFTWQFQSETGVHGTWDASGNIAQINAALNQLLTNAELLLPINKTGAINDLSRRANIFGDLLRDAEAKIQQIQNHIVLAEENAILGTERAKATQNTLVQAEETLAKLQALNQQAIVDASNVVALVEKIKTVGGAAETLEQLIESYQSKFEAFQKQLDERNTQFNNFEKNTAISLEKNSGREKEIDRLIQAADSMISGATTAGLAKSMEDTRARYQERMKGAQKGFYLAVSLLVISALPLAAHLMPEVFKLLLPSLDVKSQDNPYSMIGKIFILLPATWLTAFFTKSYADFFHLEREYAHKAALAMSVDGFKRQAKKYEEEITAEVFLEIRNNPAKGKPVEAASHPLYDVLSKVVRKVLEKKDEK